ncbi:hypothetical protein GCM10009854_43650 [Saccharopolyspora halophila]|uniref:Uncharacterized protein n=1 Tax=Saccharopolyspora halophila TaxID=405551 RepID=A0ABN3GSX4_9PSEU
MHLPESERDHSISDSSTSFRSAIEEWYRACSRACSENRDCADRYAAVVEALITWLAENPAAARIYFGGGENCAHPELESLALAARQRMTSTITELIVVCGEPEHRTKIEFVVGAVREIIREELRRETVDHTRLAHKLTRLTPLLSAAARARHA